MEHRPQSSPKDPKEPSTLRSTCLFESSVHSNAKEVSGETADPLSSGGGVSREIKKPNPLIPAPRRQQRVSALRKRVVGVKELVDLIGGLDLEASIKAEIHVMDYGGHGDLA